MDSSAVSEASTMLYISDTHTPGLMETMAMPQHQHHHQQSSSRRRPVKRQSSCLSGAELMVQTADFLAQQQVSWVQLWPADTPAHVPQHTSASCTSQQQMAPLPAAAMVQQPQLQASSSGNTLDSYGYEAAAGHVGPMQAAVLDAAAAGGAALPGPPGVLGPEPGAYPAATAAGAVQRAPHHRLPKRRASAPHLAAVPATNSQQVMFKCIPHTGGPDCQCTTCLCKRTDELCQRLIAQRADQTPAAQEGWAAAAAAAATALQPPSLQQQQARSVQSPVRGKRCSFELPPTAKGRKSQDSNRLSPSGSLGQGIVFTQQQQQQPYAAAACGVPAEAAAAAAAQHAMLRAASGPLNGQFQQLSMSITPLPGIPGDHSAAAGAFPAQQQAFTGRHVAGLGQGQHGHSEDAAVDRELEQLLAGVAWPAAPSAAGAVQPAGASLPQLQAQLHQLQAQYGMMQPLQPVATGLPARAAAAVPVPAAAVVNGYAPPACASLDPADLLSDLEADMRLPSFDKWGNTQGPASNTLLPELDPDRSELALLEEFLDSHHAEEASLVDLLLN